ncbi:unnamed protein product [Ixodes pacificus]
MSQSTACGVCGTCVPTDGRFMTCADCHKSLHLGQCAGIADATFTTMGATKREKWRCKQCRGRDGRTSAGEVEAASQDDHIYLFIYFGILPAPLDVLLSLRGSVDTLLTLPAKVDALLALKPTVEWLQTTVKEVEESVTFINAQYDSMVVEAAAQKQFTQDLRVEVGALQATVAEQATTIRQLQAEMNDADQQRRLTNLEIKVLPSTTKENLGETLCDLASNIGISHFKPSDVVSAPHLPSKKAGKPDNAPLILMSFASVALKEQWMGCRGRLRILHRAGTLPNVFLNENLTRANRELFWMARNRGKEKEYKFIWTKNAQIYAKKNADSAPLRINSAGDIAKIV